MFSLSLIINIIIECLQDYYISSCVYLNILIVCINTAVNV